MTHADVRPWRIDAETWWRLKFTLIVFCWLLLPLLLVAPCMALNAFLMGCIALLAPGTLPISDALQYVAWSLAPLGLIACIFAFGWVGSILVRRVATAAAWFAVWVLWALLMFPVALFGILILSSLGASDYSAAQMFDWAWRAATLVTLAGQIGIAVWLMIAARIVAGM